MIEKLSTITYLLTYLHKYYIEAAPSFGNFWHTDIR